MHYPVYKVTTESRATFYKGEYRIQLQPLRPMEVGQTFTTVFGASFDIAADAETQLKEARMELWGRRDENGFRVPLTEPPLPVLNSVPRPHGSILDFGARPPYLVHSSALVKYLRFLGMRIKSEHPRTATEVLAHPTALDAGLRSITYSYRGLLELVNDVIICGREPMTAEEAEVIGKEDPIPWEFNSDDEESGPWTLSEDFLKVREVLRECDLTDDKITDWFGVCNANRDRAKKLFRNGHIDVSTVKVSRGRLIGNDNPVVITQAVVTASQRVRAYNTVVVYDLKEQRILRPPASSCECVVHLGPGCSHELSCVLLLLAVTQLRGPEDIQVFPSHVVAVQRIAMTIDYAHGVGSIQRAEIFSKTKLPTAVTAASSGLTALEGAPVKRSEVPDPCVHYVRDLIKLWRKQRVGAQDTANQIRLKHIHENTLKEVSQYPRVESDQRLADGMRERMYAAYLNKYVRG